MRNPQAYIHEEIVHDGFRFIIPQDQRVIWRSDGTAGDPWILAVQPYIDDCVIVFPYSCVNIEKGSFSVSDIVRNSRPAWMLGLGELRSLGEGFVATANEMEEEIND